MEKLTGRPNSREVLRFSIQVHLQEDRKRAHPSQGIEQNLMISNRVEIIALKARISMTRLPHHRQLQMKAFCTLRLVPSVRQPYLGHLNPPMPMGLNLSHHLPTQTLLQSHRNSASRTSLTPSCAMLLLKTFPFSLYRLQTPPLLHRRQPGSLPIPRTSKHLFSTSILCISMGRLLIRFLRLRSTV